MKKYLTSILCLITIVLVAKPPRPVASFRCGPHSGLVPLQVQFTNTSSGSYYQAVVNFGDNTSAAIVSTVSHTYAFPGVFSAYITAIGKSGSSSSDFQTITATNATPLRTVLLGWTGPPGCTYTAYQGTVQGNWTRWIMTTNLSCAFSNMQVGTPIWFSGTATSNGMTSGFASPIGFTP